MDFFRKSNRSSTVEGLAVASVNSSFIKSSIKSKLVESIKDLQADYGEGNPERPIETSEQTHTLVTAIEAIFIHGLKGQASRAIKATNHKQLPEPNFWTFVLVFSHKDTIHQIEKLSAVTTDIGKGRAWIRLALNEGLLISYLTSMCADKTTLRRHYQRFALLRDGDTMDVLIKYLNGIEIYRFGLALNSGLLNRWATGPLLLAGLCVSETSSEPAPSMAIDAASLIAENGMDSLTASTPPVAGASAFEVIEKPAGYLNRGLLNEDEALKLILAGVSSANFSGSSSNTESPMGTPKSPPPIKSYHKPVRSEIFAKSPSQDSKCDPYIYNLNDKNNEIDDDEEDSTTTYESALPFEETKPIDSGDFKNDEKSVDAVNPFDEPEGEETVLNGSDDEDDIDIYYRRDSSSCEKEIDLSANETSQAFVTCPLISDNVDDDEKPHDDPEGDRRNIFTTQISKRTYTGLGSSKSSSSAGSSVTLAVPYLAGFIDRYSFKKFNN